MPIHKNRRLHIQLELAATGAVTSAEFRKAFGSPEPPAMTAAVAACLDERLRAHFGAWNDVGVSIQLELSFRVF
jgi:hypothetical protein